MTTREQMSRHYHRAIAFVHEDEDAVRLQIELSDDRSVVLTYPKPGGIYDGEGEEGLHYTIWTGSGEHEFGSLEQFEDWAKIAVGLMRPERERQFLCQICDDEQGFGPILRDDVWDAIAPKPRGMMCLPCMQIRATACLGRELTKADVNEPYGNSLDALRDDP